MILAVIFCLAATACEDEQPVREQDRSVPVETVDVWSSDFERTVRGIGTTEAAETVMISPETSGVIREIHFQEGERVQEGDLLYTIRSEKLRQELESRRSALEAAQARLQNARTTYNRFSRLYEQQTVSEEEFDEAKTAFETARAEVNQLEAEVRLVQERLEDTRIRAPMDGTLSESDFDPGDYVDEGDPLVTLFRVDLLEIAFTVAGRYMGQVEQGQTVRLRVDAYPERAFNGKVTFVSPNVDPQTRSFLVKAVVENPKGLLKPGAFATVVLVLEVHEDQPTVPEEAPVAVRGGYILFVVEQGKAQRREIEIGLREPGRVEVTEGVRPGETVIRAGQMAVSSGDPVRIVTRETRDQGQPPAGGPS